MSSRKRSRAGNHKHSKGQRLEEMARKKDQRAVRAAHRKERKAQSYLADDENFSSFSTQLAKLGLQLRDIPGDGNCLFRALGDQLDGHSKNHLTHRAEVVDYMVNNRQDFEPFVEDDVPFDRHVSNLQTPGTYAGNDAIVAFARLHEVNIIIHQLGSPCLEIHGSDSTKAKQLHISYHNGDHYCSVRKVGSLSTQPSNIKLKAEQQQQQKHEDKQSSKQWHSKSSFYNGYHSDDGGEEVVTSDPAVSCRSPAGDQYLEDIAHVCGVTGCLNEELVRQVLEDNGYDMDATLATILSLTQNEDNDFDPGQWEEEEEETIDTNAAPVQSLPNSGGARPKQKASSTTRKRQSKLEKKKRAEQRHRDRILNASSHNSMSPAAGLISEDDDEHVIAQEIAVLQI